MSNSNNIFGRLLKDRQRLGVALFSSFASCILIVSLTYFAASIGKPFMGIRLSMHDQGWAVVITNTNGFASQSGIREGDIPVEINGQVASIFLQKYEKVGAVFGRLIKELTVVDNDGQLKSVTLKGGTPSWQSVVGGTNWLITSLVFWITGFYVFFRRPKNMAALLLCLCGLAFGLALSTNMAADSAISVPFWLETGASTIGPWLLLHFFLVLPEERTKLRNNPRVYLIYLPAAITLILLPVVGVVDGQPVLWFRAVRLLEWGAGFLAAVIVAFFNYFSTTSVRTRQQMRIVLAGCLAALVPWLFLSILPDAIWRQAIIPSAFGVLWVVFIPLAMGYAVVTQKLMDIDVIIRRGVIYGLITMIMAAILSAAIFPIIAFQKSLGVPEDILIALVLGGIATVLFGPTKRGIETLVDRVFYRDRYDYRQIIQSLSTALNLAKDSTEVSRLIVGTVVHTLNLAGGSLFIKTQPGSLEIGATQGTYADTSKQVQLLDLISKRSRMIEFPNYASTASSDIAFLIPLVAAEKEVGILCISQKLSRQDFSSDDMYLLQGIASVAAIALHSIILIRDVNIRDTFVSVASHELRTPLTSIVGYADLLMRRDPPDDTRKRWLKNILDNGQRISGMVDDLLNVSRIHSGKLSIKLEKVRISVVLEEILSLTNEATDKNEFVIDAEPDLDVLVDREKFSQVLGNLLSNAIKYSPNGGRIMLSAHSDQEKQRIVVSVSDEGIGIGPTDRDLLFTTFHRIQRPETEGIKGSGLGLYIAKEWIEAMGGRVWIESELNKGSTFFVSIPIRDSGETQLH